MIARRLISALIGMAVFPVVATTWAPPDNPVPAEILREARQDTRAGRYPEALAKHLWVFGESLTHRPSFAGVRSSFALADWYELGLVFPPALAAMKQARDDAEGAIRGGADSWRTFSDLAALNRVLEADERTVQMFAWLTERRPQFAREVWGTASRALSEAGRLEMVAPFIEVSEVLADLRRVYSQLEALARRHPRHSERRVRQLIRAEKFVAGEARSVITALVSSGRSEAAEEFANGVRRIAGGGLVERAIEQGMSELPAY